jgi:hypothetical protein
VKVLFQAADGHVKLTVIRHLNRVLNGQMESRTDAPLAPVAIFNEMRPVAPWDTSVALRSVWSTVMMASGVTVTNSCACPS